MSIEMGKVKNWGSRTGRRQTRKTEQTLVQQLEMLGCTDDVLAAAIANPEGFKAAAKGLLDKRESLRAGRGPVKIAHKTKLGTLYQGDCLKALAQVEDESVDCVFADPPFNLSKEYSNGRTDLMPEEEYLEWTRAWLDACSKKLKPGGTMYIYNIPKWSVHIAAHLSKTLTFRHWIAVDITFSLPIPKRLYPSHYSLLYYVKGDHPNRFTPPRLPMETCPRCGKELHDYGGYKMKMNPAGISLRDVWVDIPPVRHAKFKNRDANQLSVKLLDRILDISTEEGDVVLDPFGGSGTTYAVAELKKRRWIGTELGDCRHIVERFQRIQEDQNLLERYRKKLNQLFTDEALVARQKSGLPLDNYRIDAAQLRRVFGHASGCPQPSLLADL